jgi:hypothetical protein
MRKRRPSASGIAVLEYLISTVKNVNMPLVQEFRSSADISLLEAFDMAIFHEARMSDPMFKAEVESDPKFAEAIALAAEYATIVQDYGVSFSTVITNLQMEILFRFRDPRLAYGKFGAALLIKGTVQDMPNPTFYEWAAKHLQAVYMASQRTKRPLEVLHFESLIRGIPFDVLDKSVRLRDYQFGTDS